MASVCLPRNNAEREIFRFWSGSVSVSRARLFAIAGASRTLLPKMMSADGPDALGTRRDSTTLATPGAASRRNPDVSPQNGPPANDDTELAPRLYKMNLSLPE
jgi:hypothetical protein